MSITEFLSRFENPRKTKQGHVVKCPAHEDKTASLSISEGNNGQILVKCFAGCTFQSIVSSLGLTARDLFNDQKQETAKPYRRINAPEKKQTEPESGEPKSKYSIEREYSYTDVFGNEVYQALRLVPKSFRQRHRVNGNWVWTMTGVERVLYRLPHVLAADTVWVLEGEKDVENMVALGFEATCNVGGAGKWMDGYTESLAGKNVILCGDNDKPGQEHISKVFDSIAGKAKTVKIVKVPSSCKDASDFIATFPSPELARCAFDDMAMEATPFVDGVKLPVYTMAEIEPKYKRQATEAASLCLDLSNWLPALRNKVRPLIPGDFALVIAGTGVGKTNILQNIWLHSAPLKTLMFEAELSEELIFERFMAMKFNATAKEVEDQYKSNQEAGSDVLSHEFSRLLICPESKLTLESMEAMIIKSELKMGEKIQLVLIDYVQLLQAFGSSRYERSSNIAEGLKVLAKSTRTIIVACSQVSRPAKKNKSNADDEAAANGEPSLHDAKDSGSLENSAGLAIGAWRDKEDGSKLYMRVLKATKGGGGTLIKCNFDGARSLITACATVADEDVPRSQHANE